MGQSVWKFSQQCSPTTFTSRLRSPCATTANSASSDRGPLAPHPTSPAVKAQPVSSPTAPSCRLSYQPSSLLGWPPTTSHTSAAFVSPSVPQVPKLSCIFLRSAFSSTEPSDPPSTSNAHSGAWQQPSLSPSGPSNPTMGDNDTPPDPSTPGLGSPGSISSPGHGPVRGPAVGGISGPGLGPLGLGMQVLSHGPGPGLPSRPMDHGSPPLPRPDRLSAGALADPVNISVDERVEMVYCGCG